LGVFHFNPSQTASTKQLQRPAQRSNTAMELEHSHSPSSSSTSSSPSPSILSSTSQSGTRRQADDGISTTSGSSLSLASAESRMVLRSKLLVFFVLFIAAVACGASAYIFARESELNVFRQQVSDKTISFSGCFSGHECSLPQLHKSNSFRLGLLLTVYGVCDRDCRSFSSRSTRHVASDSSFERFDYQCFARHW
jgi:hypothetical protein